MPKTAIVEDEVTFPTEVWASAETKEELEDWLTAKNPKTIGRLRKIRAEEDVAGKGVPLDTLARKWNIKL